MKITPEMIKQHERSSHSGRAIGWGMSCSEAALSQGWEILEEDPEGRILARDQYGACYLIAGLSNWVIFVGR